MSKTFLRRVSKSGIYKIDRRVEMRSRLERTLSPRERRHCMRSLLAAGVGG